MALYKSLGANIRNDGVDFAVYSEGAASVQLCLFDPNSSEPTHVVELDRGEDHIWRAHVADIGAGHVYGYRAAGEYNPEQGLLFDPRNILLDPYAKELIEYVDQNGSMHILGCVTDDTYDWENDISPKVPWPETVFYELHPKGFSQTNPLIGDAKRGSLSALAEPASIQHLKSLGVTSIELMPTQAFLNEKHLENSELSNYWGYNTLAFFAPHAGYLATGSASEFKDMVKAMHAEGIEVIMDVVYNHTAEGSEAGPVISMKGLDNRVYYRLEEARQAEYVNESGCGNTTNITHPAYTRLVLDSLRYWVEEFHIDGFRFDLALSLARNPKYFGLDSPFLQGIEKDPVLSKVKLIAEPWDCAGYELGRFPANWAEWNDKYRDGVRQYWRGDPGSTGELAERITGSSDKFSHSGRGPQASVNALAVHDGFTLHDTVSYSEKHNLANGEDNRDGHSHNLSANYGAEGETDDAVIMSIREQQKRNMLATLFLSKGTPLILAGDEFGNTQGGNNNTYCQDNEIGWLNWDAITDQGRSLQDFVAKMTAFRKEHPVLTQAGYLHGHNVDEHNVPDISWYNANGQKENWHDPYDQCLAVLFNNAALPVEENPEQSKERLLVIFNSSMYGVDFDLPDLGDGSNWTQRLCTVGDNDFFDRSEHKAGSVYVVPPQSLQVFTCHPA
jgi:glycogen operon protein